MASKIISDVTTGKGEGDPLPSPIGTRQVISTKRPCRNLFHIVCLQYPAANAPRVGLAS